jgi:hypothetical protein
MTQQWLTAGDQFWSQLTEWLRATSTAEDLTYRDLSTHEFEIRTPNGRVLHVRYCPDDRRQLNYNLDDGFLVEFQVVSGKGWAKCRSNGVNYGPETLGRRMVSELSAEDQ